MNKKRLTILCVLLAAMTAGCGTAGETGRGSDGGSGPDGESPIFSSDISPDASDGGSPEPEEPPVSLGINVLKDSAFKNGFNLLGTDSSKDGTTIFKKIRYGSTLGTPQWSLAQWWSKYNLKDGAETALADRYVLKDASKALTVDMDTYDVTLALNAAEEFDAYQHTAPSVWPHFLIEQALAAPSPLAGAKSLTAKLDFVVDKTVDRRDSDGAGFHAQFVWYIYIVDKNPDSEGYGNFLWFGLDIYDPPMEVAPGYSSQDTAGGAGNFIYSLSSDTFLDTQPQAGKETNLSFDVLPYVKGALETAQERGFMAGTTVDDCSVTGTNIGWEVFDRWDVSITVKDIGIYRQ